MSNSELIAQTLENEAEAAEEAAKAAERRSIASQGARDVLGHAAKNIGAMVPTIEEEIASDTELSQSAKERTLHHISRTLRRVTTSMGSLAASQQNEIQIQAGQQTMATSMAKEMRKRAAQTIEVAKRREEVKKEKAAKEATKSNAKPKAKKAIKKKSPPKKRPPAKSEVVE